MKGVSRVGACFAALVACALLVPSVAAAKSVGSIPMHRMYNPYTGEHFYTARASERDSLVGIGWRYEGVGWNAPEKSDTPVYRLFNRYVPGGDHHYTMDVEERDRLVSLGWTDEGIGWYSDDGEGEPLYREFNPYATVGTHNYTLSEEEHRSLVKVGWHDEGVAWYGISDSVGTWRGELTGNASYGSANCYGGRAYPPTVTITNVDNVANTFTADVSFVVHNHAPSENAVESSAGDQTITLKNVLFTKSYWTFDVHGEYTGRIGSGYLHDTTGQSDQYSILIYDGPDQDNLRLEVQTSNVFFSYSRKDSYLLSKS